jgi:hypothetical protein
VEISWESSREFNWIWLRLLKVVEVEKGSGGFAWNLMGWGASQLFCCVEDCLGRFEEGNFQGLIDKFHEGSSRCFADFIEFSFVFQQFLSNFPSFV